MASPNTLKLRASLNTGLRYIRVIPSYKYNPQTKIPSQRDMWRALVKIRKESKKCN